MFINCHPERTFNISCSTNNDIYLGRREFIHHFGWDKNLYAGFFVQNEHTTNGWFSSHTHTHSHGGEGRQVEWKIKVTQSMCVKTSFRFQSRFEWGKFFFIFCQICKHINVMENHKLWRGFFISRQKSPPVLELNFFCKFANFLLLMHAVIICYE